MALIINEILRARNHILFQDGKADLLKAKQNVHAKFIEFSNAFSPVIHPSPEQSIAACSPPPENWIKVNVDAPLNDTRSALAVVARTIMERSFALGEQGITSEPQPKLKLRHSCGQ